MKVNLPETLPYLPGHSFSDPYKQNFHKTQQFELKDHTKLEKTRFVDEPLDDNLLDTMNKGTLSSTGLGRRKPTQDYVPRVQPPWLKYDRKVLRFYGYFQEHVVESPLENYRLRKCIVYFYLSDSTIHITEPRVENSGVPQGIFIKRQRIPLHMGFPEPFICWYDLGLRKNITFYEKNFRICSCDAFTREFYEYMGEPLGEAEPMPEDAFDRYMEKKDLKINPPDTKEYKEYFQVKEGGGHPNGGLSKYLSNDRKVLSFKALWNDTSLEGGLVEYIVNFFLADETVEVKEVRKLNSGRDPFPLLLRRMKLPKEPVLTHYPGMTLLKEDYYQPRDFTIGSTVVIYGRPCLICDCDQFTRGWFKDNLGVQQQAIQLESEPMKQTTVLIPPYNGYGTEEDSLGSIYYLQPKPPKKDMIKMFTSDQNILRFEARLISPYKADEVKKFIITFFCGDDTISVFQPPERNSGIWGGKFLERMKHKKDDRYLKETDFQIGNVVKLGAFDFQLIRADQFTSNYMASFPERFPQCDLSRIESRISQAAKKSGNPSMFLMNLVKSLDPKKSGFTTFDLLKAGLAKEGVELTWQECHRLAREGNIGPGWKISLERLWTVLGGSR